MGYSRSLVENSPKTPSCLGLFESLNHYRIGPENAVVKTHENHPSDRLNGKFIPMATTREMVPDGIPKWHG